MGTAQEIAEIADYYARKFIQMHPACVMCQGEFSLAVAVIRRLQAAGIRCVCACSERKVVEEHLAGGVTRKISVFEFRQFREYDISV